MIETRRLEPDDWRRLRAIRLMALREAPYAFGSTHERELGYSEADWRSKLLTSAWFAALVKESLVGVAVGMHRDELQHRRELLSMWIEPAWRGSAVARCLVSAVSDWARRDDATLLTLCVAEGNERAVRCYEKLGFTPTGVRLPLAGRLGVETTEFGYQL